MRRIAVFIAFVLTAAFGIHARTLNIGLLDDCTSDGVHVGRNYVDAAFAAGYNVFVIPRTEDATIIRRMLKRVDVLMLTGGVDVNPARYGAAPSPKLGAVSDKRDACEYAVLKVAAEMKKPIFGTCRGVQVINTFFGGTLWQDIPSEIAGSRDHRATDAKTGMAHVIKIAPKSRLRAVLGVDTVRVNSYHHQAVQRLAPGFRVTAVSDDGIVEAIECDSLPVVGVQFHPEATIHMDSTTIFKKLYENMKKWIKK